MKQVFAVRYQAIIIIIIIINALIKVTLSQRTVAGALNNNNNRTLVSTISLEVDCRMTTMVLLNV